MCLVQTFEALALVRQGWEWVAPGGKLHPSDFLEVYKGHYIIEAILGAVILYLFFQSSYRWSKKKTNIEALTEEVNSNTMYFCLTKVHT